ncbi:hypothetical protein TWF106_010295 [Orbilia oligospora]|uniref:Uncharacterized protein n=1 Tax=Orbilia oligospora TaxID=2813651 RepID=A0A7C8UHR9_ORBOL|nr:hypothetical protein TWF106_010295 [Orbilia oligospora]
MPSLTTAGFNDHILHRSTNVYQPNNLVPATKRSLLPKMPPKTPGKSKLGSTLQTIPETPIEAPGHIPHKTMRLRYIRGGAARILSKTLGKNIEAKEVSFMAYAKTKYNWFIAVTTILNEEIGTRFTTEYDLPDWTKEPMWLWKSHQSMRMIDWLDHKFLKAEIIEGKAPRVRENKLGDLAGTKKIEMLHLTTLFNVQTKGQRRARRRALENPWTQPSVNVKEPASEFIAWMTGSADDEIIRDMNEEYLGIKDEDEERRRRGIYISYGGFGGDPVITEAPMDEDILNAQEMAEDGSEGMEWTISYVE